MEKTDETLKLMKELRSLRRSPKLGRLYAVYLRENRAFLKETTLKRTQSLWDLYIEPYARTRADAVSPLWVQHELLSQFIADGRCNTALVCARLLCQVLDFAVTIGAIKENPAARVWDLPAVRGMRLKSAQNVTHRPSFDHREITSELKKLIKLFEKTNERRRLLLKLSLMLLLRPGEIVRLKITDLDEKEHILIARCTKTRALFKIPSDSRLEALLKQIFETCGDRGTGWIFCGIRDHRLPLSPQTLNRALKDLGYKGRLCAHGIRSIGSNFFAHHDKEVPPYVREAILQHSGGKVERAYRRDDDYLKQRRKAMSLWWDYLDRLYA